MKYLMKRIELVNIACFEKKVFDFEKTNLFLLPNGRGKTTLLKSITFALTGEYPDGLKRMDAMDCCVRLTFENGFVVERIRKDKSTTSRIGIGNDTKSVTKEAANREIAKLIEADSDSIRVLVSSSALFNMNSEQLGKFIMDNIPGTLTRDIVVSYITGCTDRMKDIINDSFPTGQFGQTEIEAAFKKIDEERKVLGRSIRQEKTKLASFNNNAVVRRPEEIRKDLDLLSEKIGAAEAQKKALQEYCRLEKQKNETLSKLASIKEEYNRIEAEKPDPKILEKIKGDEIEIRNRIMSNNKVCEAGNVTRKTAVSVKEALQRGMCPQVEGVLCPKDWTLKIAELASQIKEIDEVIDRTTKMIREDQERLLEISKKRDAYDRNAALYERKAGKYMEYITLKEHVPVLPERKPETDPDDKILLKKEQLEKEMQASILFYDLKKIYDLLPEKEAEYAVYEYLSRELSNKGEVMQKTLSYYLSFFEDQIQEKAEKAGYEIKFYFENGLQILICRKGKKPVPVGIASKGERTVCVFLLLDLLHQMTGVDILMIDEIETIDIRTLGNLMDILEKYGEFSQVFFAGVDHSDIKDLQ